MFEIFKKKKKPQNLKEVLKVLGDLKIEVKNISNELGKLKKESEFFLRKIEIIRYNPFGGVGGDQSFSIALLDNNNDGIIITSLYTKDGNRVYAKPITNGESMYSLSDEEKKVIFKAMESSED